MNLRWIENARRAFAGVYGERRGVTVCNAVIPGVMGDFRRLLAKADPDTPVREDYRTDDLKTDIHMEGYRKDAGGAAACVITKIAIGGKPIDLGEKELTI